MLRVLGTFSMSAAHVFGVDAALGEGQVVHREDLFLHQAAALVVAVLVLAEELQH